MKNILFYFPFLFGITFLISCHKNDLDKELENEYSKIREHALKLESVQKIDSAFYYLNTIATRFPDKYEWQVYAKLEQARLYQVICDFSESEAITTEAIKLDKNGKYSYYLYNMLGTAYEGQFNYSNALKYHYLAIESTDDELLKKISKNNIAVVFLEQKKYIDAINILNSLIKEDVLKKSKDDYARVTDNLGFAYFNNGDKNKAYQLISQSLNMRDSLGEEYQKLAPLIHLARFFKDSIISESNRFAFKAYEVATKVNSPDDRLESLDILIRNTSDKEQFKNYYEKFSLLKDSIDFVRSDRKNQFAKIKYDASLAIEEGENQKKQKIIYLLLLIVSVLLAVFVFYVIRKKNKEKILVNTYETETRISKKLHDELANDVFNTMTFIETQDLQNEANKENVLQGLDSIYVKARNISKQTSEVITGKDFDNQLNQLLMSYNSKQVTIIVKGTSLVEWEKIKPNKQIEIYRILSELLVNMRKHSQAKVVLISFEALEKTITIQYKDDGKGFENKKIIKNGLLNVENRIQTINGTITFDSEINKGVKVNIEFPK